MIGVFTGTYSSIFLCSPVFYELTKKEGLSKYERQSQKKQNKRERNDGVRA